VFVWVPEYIWDEIEHIPCPHCGGRAQPDGWNCEPRRVFLEEDVCYMIGFRYRTAVTGGKEERTTVSFNPWDADVLARMDDFVSMEFPFVLTKKAAICKNLVQRLSDDLLEGKGFAATSKSLEKAYSATYVKHLRSYVSLVNRRKAQLKGVYGKDVDVGKIPMFGRVGDPEGFNSNYPSAHYLRDVWHKWFFEIPVVQRRAQMVDGRLMAGDASFKYAKGVRLATGPDGTRARPVYGIFTIMNEYDQ
ncbi:unnamed protein product, partial [Laminaria digitata]